MFWKTKYCFVYSFTESMILTEWKSAYFQKHFGNLKTKISKFGKITTLNRIPKIKKNPNFEKIGILFPNLVKKLKISKKLKYFFQICRKKKNFQFDFCLKKTNGSFSKFGRKLPIFIIETWQFWNSFGKSWKKSLPFRKGEKNVSRGRTRRKHNF